MDSLEHSQMLGLDELGDEPIGCCRLGSEYVRRSNILHETENFFVVPTIGQIGIEGYVLICSKTHRIGLGDISPSQHDELEKLLSLTRHIVSSAYKIEPIVFEHGPRTECHKGGSCLDHAHLHVVPASVDLLSSILPLMKRGLNVDSFFMIERTEGFHRFRKVFTERKTSYLFLEGADRERFLVEVNFPIPSQYLRQIIASEMGSLEWDWRCFPHHDSFARTVERLKGKFQDGT